jgi:hypothetical protein
MLIAVCALSLSLTGLAIADGHDGGNGGQKGPESSNDQKRVRARLSGPAIGGEKPMGTARSVTQDGQSRFTVEVEDINLPDGTMLDVVLIHEGNRMRVGDMTLSQGSAELERRSRDGDQVPQPQSGDVLRVLHGSTDVLAGVFF